MPAGSRPPIAAPGRLLPLSEPPPPLEPRPGLAASTSFTRSRSFDEVLDPTDQNHSTMLQQLGIDPDRFRDEFNQICKGILPNSSTSQHDYFNRRCASRAAYALRAMHWGNILPATLRERWLNIQPGLSAVNLSSRLMVPYVRSLLLKFDWIGDTLFTRIKVKLPAYLISGTSVLVRFGQTATERATSFAGQLEWKKGIVGRFRYKQQHGYRCEDNGSIRANQRQILQVWHLRNDIGVPIWRQQVAVDLCPTYEVIELCTLDQYDNRTSHGLLYDHAGEPTQSLPDRTSVAQLLQPQQLLESVENLHPGSMLALERSRLQHGGLYLGVVAWLQNIFSMLYAVPLLRYIHVGGQLQNRNQQRIIIMRSQHAQMLWVALSNCDTEVHRLSMIAAYGGQVGWSQLRLLGSYRIYVFQDIPEQRHWLQHHLLKKLEQSRSTDLDSDVPLQANFSSDKPLGDNELLLDPWLQLGTSLPMHSYVLTEGQVRGNGFARMQELLWRLIDSIPMRSINADVWIPSWVNFRQVGVTTRMERQEGVNYLRCHAEQKQHQTWGWQGDRVTTWSASLWQAPNPMPTHGMATRTTKSLELTYQFRIDSICTQTLQKKWLTPLQHGVAGNVFPATQLRYQHRLKHIGFELKITLDEEKIAQLLSSEPHQRSPWMHWLMADDCLVKRSRNFMRYLTGQGVQAIGDIMTRTAGALTFGFQFPGVEETLEQSDKIFFRWYSEAATSSNGVACMQQTQQIVQELLQAKQQLSAINEAWIHPAHLGLQQRVNEQIQSLVHVCAQQWLGTYPQIVLSSLAAQPQHTLGQRYRYWQHWHQERQRNATRLNLMQLLGETQRKHVRSMGEEGPPAYSLDWQRLVREKPHAQALQGRLEALALERTGQSAEPKALPGEGSWLQWCSWSGLKVLMTLCWLNVTFFYRQLWGFKKAKSIAHLS